MGEHKEVEKEEVISHEEEQRKGQVEEVQCVLSEVEFINKIMGVAA